MSALIVTSFGAAGYERYGRRFCETFAKAWNPVDDLVCYVEEPAEIPRGETRLLSKALGASEFLARHADSPLVQGRAPTPAWRDKEREAGYSYRTDAYKFARKVFAIADAAAEYEGSILAWIDADVVVLRRTPRDLVAEQLENADVAYLGRKGPHSECGFLAFRLPQALPLIRTWQDFYADDTFLAERQWHDSYLFDRARERHPEIKCRDLTPGMSGHVWPKSPLAPYMDHCKGEDRKRLGYSPERFSVR